MLGALIDDKVRSLLSEFMAGFTSFVTRAPGRGTPTFRGNGLPADARD
jgi:hypothetical protein